MTSPTRAAGHPLTAEAAEEEGRDPPDERPPALSADGLLTAHRHLVDQGPRPCPHRSLAWTGPKRSPSLPMRSPNPLAADAQSQLDGDRV